MKLRQDHISKKASMSNSKTFIKRIFNRSNTFSVEAASEGLNDNRVDSFKQNSEVVENNNQREVKSCVVSEKEYQKMLKKERKKAKTKLELKISCNPDVMNPHCMLFYAVQYKDFDLLEHVMKTYPGFDINQLNDDGIAAIHFAAMVGSTESIAILKSFGADIDKEDIRGNPPFHYAILMKKYNFAGALLRQGARDIILHNQSPELLKGNRFTWHTS